jgi:hypothetical protein
MENLMQKELTFIDLIVIQDIESIDQKLFYEIVKSKPATVAENIAYPSRPYGANHVFGKKKVDP